MYDLSEIGNIPRDFNRALASRPDNLKTISCHNLPGPEEEMWSFDRTESITSIVTDVSNKV